MAPTATELAARVRVGEVDPVDLVGDALRRVEAVDGVLGAFRAVRADVALAEAAALRDRPDLDRLPLAGVPVAVKDVVAIGGDRPRWGSRASPTTTSCDDHDIVTKLKDAGAVVIGVTRVPELCIWPMTDDHEALARNPWNPAFTAGGSSGGSAAAVAAGMVPLAHGTDGLGSVRLPAALCGLVGMKPGSGVVAETDTTSWFGMSTHGPLATSVADTGLLLSVLAQRAEFAEVNEPVAPLRIATSTRAPLGVRAPRKLAAPVHECARLLADDGHLVSRATPRYGLEVPAGLLARWLAGPVETAQGWNGALLQSRTRSHLRLGRAVLRTRLVRDATAQRWQARANEFFRAHDVLLTPTYATTPPRARSWRDKSWRANAVTSTRFAPFTGPWNLAGFPAMTLPAGTWRDGLPRGVQLVAAPGEEATLLGLAAALERMNGWQRAVAGPGRNGTYG